MVDYIDATQKNGNVKENSEKSGWWLKKGKNPSNSYGLKD